jgi:hypothetical protein
MNRIPRLVLVALLLTLGYLVPVAKADTVVIGSNSSASKYPFGMDPASASSGAPDFGTGGVYQQVYAASAFSGPITITQIAFASSGAFSSGPGMATFNFNLGLSTTAAGPGSLSTNFLGNRGADFAQVFSGSLNVPLTANDQFDLVINITPFTYDPAAGSLLLDVSLNSPTSFTGGPVLYFLAGFDPSTSRIASPTGGNCATVLDGFGLQTRFTSTTTTPTPEPGTMLLLGTSLAGLVGGFRKRLGFRR